MKNVLGNNITLTVFGESHGEKIGAVIDGLCPGIKVDENFIKECLSKRRPSGSGETSRIEADNYQIVSGVFNNYTTGAPICILIDNSNVRSKDYESTKDLARPSHVDYVANEKYYGYQDYRGGGHFSGRITAPLVFAGAICKQILESKGIVIAAHVNSIGSIKDKSFLDVDINEELISSFNGKELPLINSELEEAMREEVMNARKDMDSIGGTIECAVLGIKPGIGNPFFDSVESTLAHLMFSVPAVKGIEFGKGFDISKMRGSEANDEYYLDGKIIKTKTNNNGGILGGITNGMPIVFNVAIKPTASIFKEQSTVNIATMEETKLSIEGRHDPCIVQRALPVIEAVTAIGILELMQ